MARHPRRIRDKLLATAFVALTAAATGAVAQQPPPGGRTVPITVLVERLRNDAELRSLFAQSPSDVMRIFGVDPAPYDLPSTLDTAQLESLLNDLSRIAPPRADARPPTSPPGPKEANPVPPPGSPSPK